MKNLKSVRSISLLTTAILIIIGISSCNKDDDNMVALPRDSENIDDYIESLNYRQEDLLSTYATTSGNTDRREVENSTVENPPVNGKVWTCQTKSYELDKNFESISILRPSNNIIYPGALVYGDAHLMDGLPRPIAINRGAVELRVNLPGLQDEGNLYVENTNFGNVDTEINKCLEYWNENLYEEGYVNPSLSEYTSSESYDSKQVSMDVNMNLEWTTGAMEAQMNYESTEQVRVAYAVFKQVFYTVSMNTPTSQSSMFARDVTLEDVQNNIDNSQPAAYVSSVDYGRIIMFRIETRAADSELNLSAVIDYASGPVSGTVKPSFDQILKHESTKITAVTIGGNAEVSSEVVTADGIGSLRSVITGPNAVYSRDNPGVPIAYTIRYLRDHSLAKLGYKSSYRIQNCAETLWDHADITIRNTWRTRNIRVKLAYKDTNNRSQQTSWQTIKDETYEGIILDEQAPNGAYDVHLIIERYFTFGGWEAWHNLNMQHVSAGQREDCWQTTLNNRNEEILTKCP